MATPAPPIGFRYITLVQARTILSTRLQDVGVYWQASELNDCIREALHVFQALTSWYRQRAGLTLYPANPTSLWYDLATAPLQPLSIPPTLTSISPFGYNIALVQPTIPPLVPMQDLTSGILYALLEPQLLPPVGANPYLWGGTDQFSLQALQNAIQNRVNRFIGDSGCTLSYLRLGVDGPPVSRFPLPDTTTDVRRASWLDASSTPQFQRTNLNREDDFAMASFGMSADSEPGIPQVYSVAVETPMSIQAAPPPANVGALEMILCAPSYVADYSVAGAGTPIPIPDDFIWGVKWGAIADLLGGDGQARDPARAAYAESRYAMAVQLARMYPSVLRAQVLGTDFDVESAFDLDMFAIGWDNAPTGDVAFAASAGRNMFAISPAPALPQVISLDMSGNIPIPLADNDYLQIPRDVADPVLDYAQRIASFKMGGAEFEATARMEQNLMMVAGQYSSRLRQQAFYNDAIRQPALRQLNEVPRL